VQQLKEGYITTLGVIESYRKRGLAAQLLDKLNDTMLNILSCNYISLHVKTDNTPAINFYLKHGFVQQDELKDFYWIDGKFWSAYLMKKKVEFVEDSFVFWQAFENEISRCMPTYFK